MYPRDRIRILKAPCSVIFSIKACLKMIKTEKILRLFESLSAHRYAQAHRNVVRVVWHFPSSLKYMQRGTQINVESIRSTISLSKDHKALEATVAIFAIIAVALDVYINFHMTAWYRGVGMLVCECVLM